ncbi:VTT domain-containing protein [Nannocystis exedens]|uniref:VTT domain-containing protein n=1 Tax=Nannocystis exedens TaxID=54 RepID=UPI001FE50F49|nr:VTT domain-containing protein [Nannocystis exedens]
MSAETSRSSSHPHPWRRALVILVTIGALAALAASDLVHDLLARLLAVTETLIAADPAAGAALFVLFAALSGMFAFFSSALIVPIAVYAWGPIPCALLLWLGWTLGGACTYALGRSLGRRALRWLAPRGALARYERWATRDMPFGLVALFQLSMPSEVPGYLLGLAGYSFWRYIAVVVLGELPYAFGTVMLGESFIRQQVGPLLLLGLVGALFSAIAYTLLHRRLRAAEPSRAAASHGSACPEGQPDPRPATLRPVAAEPSVRTDGTHLAP